VHIASVLGQLDGIELPGVRAYIGGAKSVQELVDMPYPAEDLAKVCVSPKPSSMCRCAPCGRIDAVQPVMMRAYFALLIESDHAPHRAIR